MKHDNCGNRLKIVDAYSSMINKKFNLRIYHAQSDNHNKDQEPIKRSTIENKFGNNINQKKLLHIPLGRSKSPPSP